MALKKIDSFSHYTSEADVKRKWPYCSSSGMSAVGSGGRRGGGRLNVAAAGTCTVADVFADHATWIIGSYINDLTVGEQTTFFKFIDGATVQVLLCKNTDGRLAVYRTSTANLLGTTTDVIFTIGTKHYVEFKANIHGSTGTFEVRVNGISVLSGTGANTQTSANAYANKISLGGSGGDNYAVYYEDLYICDGSGSAPCNDFLGDCKVIASMPTGNGTTSNFVGSDTNSTDNYLLVDETPPNTTDYLDSLTPNDVDLANFPDISDTPVTIYGVQTNFYACKSDAGDVRTVADLIRSGGTNYPGASKTLSTDWVYLREIHEKNPNTDAAWTKTNFNSAEFGVKMVS